MLKSQEKSFSIKIIHAFKTHIYDYYLAIENNIGEENMPLGLYVHSIWISGISANNYNLN